MEDESVVGEVTVVCVKEETTVGFLRIPTGRVVLLLDSECVGES